MNQYHNVDEPPSPSTLHFETRVLSIISLPSQSLGTFATTFTTPG